jgi:hypothetical protein
VTLFDKVRRLFKPDAPEGAPSLAEDAAALARAVDGVDWNAAEVRACCRRLSAGLGQAHPEQLAAALGVLVERLERSRVEDADGVAQVALSAGAFVERGAPPRPLGEVLLRRVPAVLVAARRYADKCLADMGEETEAEGELAEDEIAAYADHRPIPRAVFSEHLSWDRGAGAALAYLNEWTLPTVTALTRDRELLVRATRDAELCAAAEKLAGSDAQWLHVLTGVELDAPWLALFPVLDRGFRLSLDGVATNFDLHALVADALMDRGIAGTRNPRDVIAVIRGESDKESQQGVAGSWNLYTYRAAAHDLAAGAEVPNEHWVWGEGHPRDVPLVEGMRTLVIGPAGYSRSWSGGRTFSALRPRVEVQEELPKSTVRETLQRLAGLARAD